MFNTIHPRRALGVLMALAVMALSASTASANQGDSVTCVFSGLAGVLNPPISVNPPLANDGTYTFTSAGAVVPPTCVSADADGARTGVVNANIESAGHYSNLVLGTGSVAGTAGISQSALVAGGNSELGAGPVPGAAAGTPVQPCPANGGPAPVAAEPTHYAPTPAGTFTTVGYGIDFKNGQGTLGGGAVTPTGFAADGQHDAFFVKGAVSIVPNPAVPCPAANGGGASTVVTSFTVAGAFTGT
jgi:hypothetical protein